MGARLALALLRLVQALPLRVQLWLGDALGALAHALAGSRRRIAQRNIERCLPELDAAARSKLVREQFKWLGRSIVDRGLFWYAPRARIESLLQVDGDIGLAARTPGPVQWIVPHFVALEAAAAAVQLCQPRRAATIYQRQSNPVFDAAVRAGRERFGDSVLFARHESAKPLLRAIKDGLVFFNLPDMDFGIKDAAFVPFFGVPAATLLAPSRMARALGITTQLVVAEMLEEGGWRVHFGPAWTDWPTDDALADTRLMNARIEAEVRKLPAQYLWVHKRFKTRPEGEAGFY
jgi:Kdo2-lipid IVA lauroyltransferase/acyltransferase